MITDKSSLTRRGKVFTAAVSPFAAYKALGAIPNAGTNIEAVKRNALAVLKRFELVIISNGKVLPNTESIDKSGGIKEAIWAAAKNERSLMECIEILKNTPNIHSNELAGIISDAYDLSWSEGSQTRNGRSLKQWALWVKESIEKSEVSIPPNRNRNKKRSDTKATHG